MYETSFVTYHGITLKPDGFLLYSVDALEPVFCKISKIIKTDTKVVLILSAEYYDNHFYAFCIKDTLSIHVCLLEDLKHHHVNHLRQTFAGDNKVYVSYQYMETSVQ